MPAAEPVRKGGTPGQGTAPCVAPPPAIHSRSPAVMQRARYWIDPDTGAFMAEGGYTRWTYRYRGLGCGLDMRDPLKLSPWHLQVIAPYEFIPRNFDHFKRLMRRYVFGPA